MANNLDDNVRTTLGNFVLQNLQLQTALQQTQEALAAAQARLAELEPPKIDPPVDPNKIKPFKKEQ